MQKFITSCFLSVLLWLTVAGSVSASDLPFATLKLQPTDLPQILTLEASIEAIHHSTVSAETSGRITEINFNTDDVVKEGQVLMRITPAQQQASLAGARASVREAEVRLSESETEFQRVQGIFEKKLVARSALDKAVADLKAAQQKLHGAEANLKAASEKLKYTSIRAPFTGVVVRRLVEVGEAVVTGKPVMEGLSLDELRVAAYAPQSALHYMRNKPEISIVFPQQQHDTLAVSDVTVSPRADALSHSFLVRANLPKFTKGVYPGMLVKMNVTLGKQTGLLIPSQAIVHRSELTAVYVVEHQQVSLRQIRIGRVVNGAVEVLAGVSAGETVALDPVRAGIILKEQRKGEQPSLSRARASFLTVAHLNVEPPSVMNARQSRIL